jgi:hypothetical protein
MTGFNMPPGVSPGDIPGNRVEDDGVTDEGVSALQDEVLGLLEDAQIPSQYCDLIASLIAMGETERERRRAEIMREAGHETA